jgi:positive regulator of sigma E activity
LTAAAIVYVLPLLLVGAGIGIGTLLSETAQIIMAISGLVLGFVIAFFLDRFVIRKRKGFSPVMKEITTGEPEIKDNIENK